ncbi:MAG: hypothetical protein JXM79_00495 [Sedimentisphaerales bacterium]|nr:hypothetical protein [Sedimentisphaerales bacterium]
MEIMIRGEGELERWDLEKGAVEAIPQSAKGGFLSTRYRFAPGGSLVVFHDGAKPQRNVMPKTEKIVARISVDHFKVTRESPNALTLDFCRYRKGDNPWSDVFPVLGVQDILSAEKYSGPVSLWFEFASEMTPPQCSVVIEEAKDYIVTVNNKEVKYNNLPYYRDKSFLPIDITHLVKPGKNIIRLSRHFEAADKNTIDNNDLGKFYGTELEQIYVIGDFAVQGEKIGQDDFECKRERFNPSFLLTKETGVTSGNLLTDGYCFFNGTLTLSSEVVIPDMSRDRKYYLDMEALDTVIAEIKINDCPAGTLGWKPYRVEITDFVRLGKNKIEIILTNSLRNLLGSLHYVPKKDSPGGQWSLKASPSLGDGARWYTNRHNNKYWSDDYFFRSFGVGKVSVLSVQ